MLRFGSALVLVLALAPAAGADAFLKLSGLDGDSKQEGREKWIDLMAASFPGSPSTPNRQAVLVRRVSGASPRLALASAEGTHFESGEIEICNGGECVSFELESVYIASYSVSTGEEPTESLVLDCKEIVGPK